MFGRKRKNRLYERETVLDVKLRADQARARQVRSFGRIGAALIGIPVALGALWVACNWGYDQVVQHNPTFAIKTIDAQTDGVVVPEQLQKWAGVRTGDNLLALDLSRVKRDLEMVPIVETAVVERVLPNTLRLRIQERQPIAQIPVIKPAVNTAGLGTVRYYVDDSGRVMLPPEHRLAGPAPSPFNDSLPVLSGISAVDVRPGLPLNSPKMQAALELLSEFEVSEMVSLAELLNVDLGEPEVIQVTTGQGSKITFAQNDIRTQLRRWRAIHDFGLLSGRAIESLDLSVTNNLPVRWVDAGAVPPPPKKPQKNSRTRRKHV